MSHLEIFLWASVAGGLGGIASHISWLLKITDDGSVSNQKDLRSSPRFRLKIMFLNFALGAVIGLFGVAGFYSFNGLPSARTDALLQILPIGFFAALFRQDIVELAKRKL